MSNRRIDSKGFSLIELIIVIAIMAVLVGVIAPMYVMYVESGREAVDVQNMDTAFQLASAMYAEDAEACGTYYYYMDGTEINKDVPSYGYGRGQSANRHTDYKHACCPKGEYDPSQDYRDKYLIVTFPDPEDEPIIHVHWSD